MDVHAEIKSRLSLENYLEENGVEIKRGRALCINPHHHDSNPSMSIKDERFKCFSCDESGDIFTAAQHLHGYSHREALQHLADRAGVSLEDNRPPKPQGSLENDIRAVSMAIRDPKPSFDQQWGRSSFFTEVGFLAFWGIVLSGSLNIKIMAESLTEANLWKGKNFPTAKINQIVFPALDLIIAEDGKLPGWNKELIALERLRIAKTGGRS
jgi:hypothetical protein